MNRLDRGNPELGRLDGGWMNALTAVLRSTSEAAQPASPAGFQPGYEPQEIIAVYLRMCARVPPPVGARATASDKRWSRDDQRRFERGNRACERDLASPVASRGTAAADRDADRASRACRPLAARADSGSRSGPFAFRILVSRRRLRPGRA
jgi:hypothetical protein